MKSPSQVKNYSPVYMNRAQQKEMVPANGLGGECLLVRAMSQKYNCSTQTYQNMKQGGMGHSGKAFLSFPQGAITCTARLGEPKF